MKHRKVVAVGLVLAVVAGVAFVVLWRGYFGPPVVTVSNGSGSFVSQVHLEGNGFMEVLPDLAPGDVRTIIVNPRGESSLKVSFLLSGAPITKGDLTYLEVGGGYRAVLTIHEGGAVECRADLGFSWRRALSWALG